MTDRLEIDRALDALEDAGLEWPQVQLQPLPHAAGQRAAGEAPPPSTAVWRPAVTRGCGEPSSSVGMYLIQNLIFNLFGSFCYLKKRFQGRTLHMSVITSRLYRNII